MRWRGLLVAAVVFGCAPQKGPVIQTPTDAQLRGPQPDLTGTWLVTEDGQPRMRWTLKQDGTALTGTITVDPRDATGSDPAPVAVQGTLGPVGPSWQVTFSQPVGYATLDFRAFRFCPLPGGSGGCRDGKQQVVLPSEAPAATAAASPGATAAATAAP